MDGMFFAGLGCFAFFRMIMLVIVWLFYGFGVGAAFLLFLFWIVCAFLSWLLESEKGLIMYAESLARAPIRKTQAKWSIA